MPENPTVATACYFTNCSYHYEANVGQANELSERISILPRHRIQQPGLYEFLLKGLKCYGHVPGFDVRRRLGVGGFERLSRVVRAEGLLGVVQIESGDH